jgi:hypothetical protein
MESFLKVTTLSDKWFLCEDLRWHIWKMSKIKSCKICGDILPDDGRISLILIRDHKCLCFPCWQRISVQFNDQVGSS